MFAKLKSTMDSIRLAVDVARAQNTLKNRFFYSAEVISEFKDVQVCLDNDVILANLATRGPNACAIPQVRTIFVNDAFLTLPESIKEAIYFHEYGHIQHNHSHDDLPTNKSAKEAAIMANECEADMYSHLQGADMISALIYLDQIYPDQPELTHRIQVLKDHIAKCS